MCFHNTDAAAALPQPNADIVAQIVNGFRQKLQKARASTSHAAQTTFPKTELSIGNDLLTIKGVSRTYVTFRLPLSAYDKGVRRIVGAPALDELSLDFRPHTRHEGGRYAPAP